MSPPVQMSRAPTFISGLLAGAALVLACSFWQHHLPEQELAATHQFGRRTAESHGVHGAAHASEDGFDSGHKSKLHIDHEHVGEHEGGAEGEGEEPSGWGAANLIAIMLMIFLFMNVFFIYLVFLRDPDIRKAIYTMLSTTMSIFIAVVINTAAFSFFLDQVIAGKGWNDLGFMRVPRGLATWVDIGVYGEFIVSVMLFVLCELGINLGVVHVDKNEDARCAVRVIGGHLMAFAGIITFGTLQINAEHFGPLGKHHYVVVLSALLLICAFRWIFGYMFDSYFDQYSDGFRRKSMARAADPAYSRMGPEEASELSEGIKEAINEGENDAVSLIAGFLIAQLAVWKTTGHLMPLHGAEHEHVERHSCEDIWAMFQFFCCSLFVVAALQIVEYQLKSRQADIDALVADGKASWFSTLQSCVILTCLMTSSWIALLGTTWQVSEWLRDSPLGTHEMAEVFTAFILTLFSVFCIIAIDKCADHLKTVIKDKSKKNPKNQDGAKSRNSTGLEHAIHHSTQLLLKTVEKTLRKWIEAFGLLVGLSWEKACHGGVDTIIESTPLFADHVVWSRLGFAMVLAAIVLPAWMWHIMPMSNKSVEDHQSSINLARIHRLHREGKLAAYLEDTNNAEEKNEFYNTISQLQKMFPAVAERDPSRQET